MLKETIRHDFTQARKDGDGLKKSALEAVVAGILLKEKSGKGDINDTDVIDSITKEIKVQKEILEVCVGKFEDKATEATNKIEILYQYLPKQLTDEEVLALIKESDIYDDKSPKTRGMIIKTVMPKVSGKFETAKVSKMVESYLEQK